MVRPIVQLLIVENYNSPFVLPRGQDFRKCFRRIGGLRAMTNAPFIALTATAPYGIKETICESLCLREPALVSHTLDRPNIFLSASKSRGLNVSTRIHTSDFFTNPWKWYVTLLYLQSDLDGIASLLKGAKEPIDVPKMIIFCQSKEAAVKIYRFLSGSAYHKESVSMFHASLTQNTKRVIQERFQSSTCTLRCLVATVAFGMVCIFIWSSVIPTYCLCYSMSLHVCHRAWTLLILN